VTDQLVGPRASVPASGAPAPAGARAVAAPPKLRRRPAVVVLSVLATCLGGLIAGWAYVSSSTAQEVVAVRSTVHRGEVVTAADVMTVRVGVDPALHVVPAARLGSVVGLRAVVDLPAGGLLTAGSVSVAVVPPAGMSVVGVGLSPSLLPGEQLRPGDPVRLIGTPAQGGEVTGPQPVIGGTVVSIRPDADNGQTLVSVQVPARVAAELAARAATGRLALVLDSSPAGVLP